VRQRQRIIELVRGASLEVSARDKLAGPALGDLVRAGTDVYINFAPGDTHHCIVDAAARLRRAGFVPVPHVAARALVGFTQLNDFLTRLAGDAGVEETLVIAGDLARPAGPFDSAFEILATGLFERHGIRRIGIAGYPEGHPKIGRRALEDALAAKLGLARQNGLCPRIVTQFGFEAAPMLGFLGRCREQGIDAPMRIGLAGPASIATLAKFAVRCGVGRSLSALTTRHAAVARLLTETGPERVIDGLVAGETADIAIAGLHLFTFGGVRRTAAWIDQLGGGGVGEAKSGAGFRLPISSG
jgi:methylenetetrahydrofolate reductase (NADPH)